MDLKKKELYNLTADAFISAFEKAAAGEIPVADIFVQLNQDELILSIYDDNEILLGQTSWEWDELKESNQPEFLIEHMLKEVLAHPDVKQSLNKIECSVPVSVIWVDEDMTPIAEVAMSDCDTVVLGDDFLDKIDRELDEFLEKLMNE